MQTSSALSRQNKFSETYVKGKTRSHTACTAQDRQGAHCNTSTAMRPLLVDTNQVPFAYWWAPCVWVHLPRLQSDTLVVLSLTRTLHNLKMTLVLIFECLYCFQVCFIVFLSLTSNSQLISFHLISSQMTSFYSISFSLVSFFYSLFFSFPFFLSCLWDIPDCIFSPVYVTYNVGSFGVTIKSNFESLF